MEKLGTSEPSPKYMLTYFLAAIVALYATMSENWLEGLSEVKVGWKIGRKVYQKVC